MPPVCAPHLRVLAKGCLTVGPLQPHIHLTVIFLGPECVIGISWFHKGECTIRDKASFTTLLTCGNLYVNINSGIYVLTSTITRSSGQAQSNFTLMYFF